MTYVVEKLEVEPNVGKWWGRVRVMRQEEDGLWCLVRTFTRDGAINHISSVRQVRPGRYRIRRAT